MTSAHPSQRPLRDKLHVVDYRDVLARLHAGETMTQIAAHYGVSIVAISKGARRHGWTAKKRVLSVQIGGLTAQDALSRLKSRLPLKVIAREACVIPATIRSFKRRAELAGLLT